MANIFKSLFSKKERRPLSKGEFYDQQTEKIIKTVCKANSNCVDAGANKGDILKLLLKYAPRGKHYAFEPIPDLYGQLVETYKENSNCKIYDLALSDQKKVSTFNYVVTNPAYSGLIKRRYDRENEEDTLIEVHTELLDNVLPEDYRVDLIKIDVEGGEFPLLRGAVRTLKTYKPVVVFEHGLGSSELYGTTPEDLHRFMTECGLKIYTLHDWQDNSKALTESQLSQLFHSNDEYYFVARP